MTRAHILDQLSLGKIVQIRERLLHAQASGKRVYRLESGDPSFSVAPHVLAALQQAAQQGKTHYVPNNGIPELRRAMVDKLRLKNGLSVPSEDCVFVTNGAMHALFVVFASLLDEGDEVLIPDPMWTEVAENIKLARGVPVGVPLRAAAGYDYEPDEIARRITPRTRALFLNTPHNPTGTVLSEKTLLRLCELADQRGLWLISDEAYEDVVYAPARHLSIGALAAAVSRPLAERTVSLYSFSKSHAMSGLRVGYFCTTSPQLQARAPKLLRCSINGVNSVAQWAALAALQGDQAHLQGMLREYEVRRDALYGALLGIDGVRAHKPQGAFYLWAELEPALYERLGIRDADELSNLLAERGVGSAPGDSFGHHCHDAIRFSFSCDTAMVEAGAQALRGILLQRL